MQVNKSGKFIIFLLVIGVLILSISTLLKSPLALFLSIVVGSGLIVLGVLAEIWLMITDIKAYFKKIDTETDNKLT